MPEKNKKEVLSNLINRTEIGSQNGSNKKQLLNISEADALKEVKAIANYYPDFISVYIPNSPILTIQKGLEKSSGHKTSTNLKKSKEVYETNIERSLRRTKKSIRDYSLCNDFDMFATFTFAKDRQNIERCKNKMSNWLKNQGKRKGKFKYLIVPEFHKDKKSLHFHALMSGYSGKLKQSVSPKGRLIKKRGKQVYEIPSYTLGFNNVQKIEHKDRIKTAFYITKYISKDMPLFSDKNRYWVSKDLLNPVKEYNPDNWYSLVKPNHEIDLDFGKVLYYNRKDNPLIDMLGERFDRQ